MLEGEKVGHFLVMIIDQWRCKKNSKEDAQS